MTGAVVGEQRVRDRWSRLPLMALTTVSVVTMDSLAVPIALAQPGTGPEVSLSLLEWTVVAYSLAFAALVPAACTLYDVHGARRMLALGQALLALASAGCALAPVGPWLILGRGAEGAAAALVVPAVLKRASRLSSPRVRWVMLPGCAGGIVELSAAAGPLMCAALAQGGDWRWIFWINVPICLLACVLAALSAEPAAGGPAQRRPLRLGGALIVGIGSFALAWGVIEGSQSGWDTPQTLLCLVLGAALLLYAAAGRLPLGMFRATEFVAAQAGYACGCAALYCVVLLLGRYFQVAEPTGRPMAAWLHLVPLCIGLLVCAPLSEPLALRLGSSRLMAIGLAVAAVALGVLAWDAHRESPYTRLLLPLLLCGCGIALALPAGRTVALVVPAKSVPGAGPAAVGALRNLGGALGVVAVGAVLTYRPTGAVLSYRPTGAACEAAGGLAPAIALVGLICLAGAATNFAVPSRRSPI